MLLGPTVSLRLNFVAAPLNFGPKVKLEDGGQVVHVAGQRAVADKVFCAVAESLSEVVPETIQAVSDCVRETLSGLGNSFCDDVHLQNLRNRGMHRGVYRFARHQLCVEVSRQVDPTLKTVCPSPLRRISRTAVGVVLETRPLF